MADSSFSFGGTAAELTSPMTNASYFIFLEQLIN
jgi:hypothetical protein